MSHTTNNSIPKFTILISFLLLFLFGNVVAQVTEISITTNSERAKELFIEGRNLSEINQLVSAAEVLDNAIKIDPTFALAHIWRAVTGIGGITVVQNHVDQALKSIDKVTQGERELIHFLTASIDGNQLIQKVYFDRLVSNYPNDKRVQFWGGVYFYTVKDFQTAKTYLMKAVDLDGNFAPVHNLLGYTELEMSQITESEQSFKTGISLLPNSPNPYDSYGEFLLRTGKYDESIIQYMIALQKDSRFTSALNGIGHNYIFKGNYDEALKNYQKSFDVTKDVGSKLVALSWMATSYIHEGKIDNALKMIEKQRSLAKENNLTISVINTYNNEGFILTEAGKTSKGMEKFEMAANMIKTTKLSEGMKETLTLKSDLNRCYGLISSNKLDEAQKRLNTITSVVYRRDIPTEIEQLNGNLGLLEIKRGNFQTAVNYLNKSDVTSDFNQYYMGMAYEKMGNKLKASECYQKVKNSKTNNMGLAVVRSRAIE